VTNVLVVDGESMFGVPVSYCLAAANRTVHVGSATRFPDVRFSRFCKNFRWWGSDASRLVDEVSAYARRRRISVILGCSDQGIRFLSENRRELERVAAVAGTPSIESLDATVDKASFGEFLGRTIVPHPKTIALRVGQAIPRKLPSFPALLKPSRSSGGRLIRRFERSKDFEDFAKNGGLGGLPWVLQTHIPGRDVNCNAICRDGKVLAATIQEPIEAISTSFAPPLALRFIHDEEALALTEQLLGALRWNGVANIDMRRSAGDGRISVIELNGRYWTSMMGSYRAGVNFPELACLDALGQQLPPAKYREIRFFRGSSGRGRAQLAETTLLWRLSDPGPVLAELLRRRNPVH
jgi:predicted ATP-grasp superfamily ATP-dependent carboligase